MKKAKRFKKVLSIVLATVMAVAMFSLPGCSSSKSGGSGSTGSTGQTETVTWWMAGTAPNDLNLVMSKLNPILKKDINVQLDMKFVSYANYDQKMKVMISSGTPYDICFTCSWANNFVQQANKGAYLPLNDLLAKDGKDLNKLIPSSLWDSAKIKGKIYGIPTYKDSGDGVFYLFPKKLAEEAKFDYKNVKSLDDITPFLEYIKKNHPELTPFPECGSADTSIFDSMDPIFTDIPVNIALEDNSCKVINVYSDPKVMAKLRTYYKWYQEGLINKDAVTATTYPKVRPLEMVSGWPDAASIWSTEQGYECVDTERYPLYMTTSSIQGSMNAISVNSKHPEAAMKLLNLVNTNPEVKNMLDFGIEGTHYTKTSDTSIKVLNKKYQPGAYAIASFFDGMYTTDPAPKDEWTNLLKYEKTAKNSPALGFMANISDTSLQTQMTVLENVYKKYSTMIECGSVDPDVYVPKMNAELDKAGMQDFISKIQKQEDTWKTQK